ncbi:hypothetical protein KKC59_00120, partial [bacterium]|nr:hypothetical protein [bacterium]
FGIFGLLDFFTSSHRGLAYKKEFASFLTELKDSDIIVNNATWDKRRNFCHSRIHLCHSREGGNLIKKLGCFRRDSRLRGNDIGGSGNDIGGSGNDIPLSGVKNLSLQNFYLDIENGDVHVFLSDEKIDLNSGGVSMLCGASGAGKTSIMQFLGARMFLNESKKTEENYFGANGRLCAIDESGKSFDVVPDNLSYKNLQNLVCYHSFDDAENFNFDVNILPDNIKKDFLYYAKMMIHDLDGKIHGNWSSGERSRVKLAFILAVNKSKFVLLDQALVNLDTENAYSVMIIIKDYAEKNGVGFLIADPNNGYKFSDMLDEVILFDSERARLVHSVQDGEGFKKCA